MTRNVRFSILKAADAPAPTIVFDATSRPHHTPRTEVKAFVGAARAWILALHPTVAGLGVKNIAVFAPFENTLRVEFFQGQAHGPLEHISQEVCLNSLACALSAAHHWDLPLGPEITCRMGQATFLLQPRAIHSPHLTNEVPA